jgi:Glycosyl hydrolase family 36 C-terminal domain
VTSGHRQLETEPVVGFPLWIGGACRNVCRKVPLADAIAKLVTQGLDASKRYVVRELNSAPGRAKMPQEGETFTGEELMCDGIVPSCSKELEASVMSCHLNAVDPSLQNLHEKSYSDTVRPVARNPIG